MWTGATPEHPIKSRFEDPVETTAPKAGTKPAEPTAQVVLKPMAQVHPRARRQVLANRGH